MESDHQDKSVTRAQEGKSHKCTDKEAHWVSDKGIHSSIDR